jgi:hypothetical protein
MPGFSGWCRRFSLKPVIALFDSARGHWQDLLPMMDQVVGCNFDIG